MIDVNFFDKYYVGFKKNGTNDNECLIGFATPIDPKSPSKTDSRKITVDAWRDKKIEAVTIDNEPTYGFEILDVVSRSRTDNKLFRIKDPRGFELEISSFNLFHIIEQCTITKSVIADKMVWSRRGQQNFLISTSSEEYKHFQQNKGNTNPLTHKVGSYYTNKLENIKYRYCGKFYALSLGINRHNYYYDCWGILRTAPRMQFNEPTKYEFTTGDIIYEISPKSSSYHVYQSLQKSYWGEEKEQFYTIVRTKYIPELKEIEFDFNKIEDYKEIGNSFGVYCEKYFTNKQDMLNYIVTTRDAVDEIMNRINLQHYHGITKEMLRENLLKRLKVVDKRIKS